MDDLFIYSKDCYMFCLTDLNIVLELHDRNYCNQSFKIEDRNVLHTFALC